MSQVPTLLVRYRAAAREHGKATDSGDYEMANSAYDELMEVLKELRATRNSLNALEDLLEDEDASVKCWAATHLLKVVPARAVTALEELARESDIAGFNAKQVLKEWRAGRI